MEPNKAGETWSVRMESSYTEYAITVEVSQYLKFSLSPTGVIPKPNLSGSFWHEKNSNEKSTVTEMSNRELWFTMLELFMKIG